MAGISSLAMTRYTQRSAGIPAETALEQRLDLQAGDERETAALTNGEECKTSDRK